PEFARLTQRMHVRAPAAELVARVPVQLYVFDVPVVGPPYEQRRAALGALGGASRGGAGGAGAGAAVRVRRARGGAAVRAAPGRAGGPRPRCGAAPRGPARVRRRARRPTA